MSSLVPPPLANDCFALPPGIDWTPVDTALGLLRTNLAPVVATEELDVAAALGRVLASDVRARRSNPPAANAAVDGYGFAHIAITGEGPQTLPLVEGRAAAGAAFNGCAPDCRRRPGPVHPLWLVWAIETAQERASSLRWISQQNCHSRLISK